MSNNSNAGVNKAPDRNNEPVKFCKFSEIYAKDLLEMIKTQ